MNTIVKSLEEKGLHLPSNFDFCMRTFKTLNVEHNIKIGLLLEYMEDKNNEPFKRLAVKNSLLEMFNKLTNDKDYKEKLNKLINSTDIMRNYYMYFDVK